MQTALLNFLAVIGGLSSITGLFLFFRERFKYRFVWLAISVISGIGLFLILQQKKKSSTQTDTATKNPIDLSPQGKADSSGIKTQREEEKKSENPFLGHFKSNGYENSFFKFKISLPSDWDISVMDKSLNKENYTMLFYALHYKKNSRGSQTNSGSFYIAAENVQNYPTVTLGSDYLESQKRWILADTVNKADRLLRISNHYLFRKLGVKDFYYMDFIYTKHCLRMYSTITNGYALIITIGGLDENNLNEAIEVVEKIDFY